MTRDLRGSFVDVNASGRSQPLFYYGAELQVQAFIKMSSEIL